MSQHILDQKNQSTEQPEGEGEREREKSEEGVRGRG